MNDLLDQLDEFFSKKKKQEQQIIFFVPFIIFAFLSFYFLYPITNDYLNKIESHRDELANKLNNLQSDIKFLKRDNMSYTVKISNINTILQKYKNQKLETDSLVAKLGFLQFDINKWAKFYNEIPMLAKKYNLKLVSLENNFLLEDHHKLVSKRIILKIKAKGSFINFLKCLNEFELKKEFIKINNLNIKRDTIDIIIYVYGVEL